MMDYEPLKTIVYVHSPILECSGNGSYYTSYAIHLMSNNPCFNHKASYVRRRYSEFVQLRQLMADHHPTLRPPNLPPKKFFWKFTDEFIDERMKGLQQFLREVIDTPVYLSDKSLHLFLQSSSSMSEISEECMGDIPAPPLYSPSELSSSFSDTSSITSSEYLEALVCTRALQNLVLDDEKVLRPGSRKVASVIRTSEVDSTAPKPKSSLRKSGSKPYSIPQRNGSLDSSPASSPSSLDTSYSSSVEHARDRRVSFNDKVKIAVVTNYGIAVLQ